MSENLDELIRLLDIEQVERNLFRAFHPEGRRGRLYGGQIMAQCLMAAARTVDESRLPHSLHAYFLRPGDPSVPGLIDVHRIRDGGSFSTRRVRVIQHGHAIFNLTASFHKKEPGVEHQQDFEGALTPPSPSQIPAGMRDDTFLTWRDDEQDTDAQQAQQRIWFRANGDLPDDPLLHSCLLVYESDNALLSTSRIPHQGDYQRSNMQVASLDHAMWFHHPVRAHEWSLYVLESPSACNARGYNEGLIYRSDGKLLCSTVQEGLIRLRG